MIARPEEQLLRTSAAVVAALRLLTEASDEQSFFATLQETLPQLLPATRIDILAAEPGEEDQPLFTCGGSPHPPPSPARHTATSHAAWLDEAGYTAVTTLPLAVAGQDYGWLLLARRHKPFDPDTLAIAAQLATVIGLR